MEFSRQEYWSGFPFPSSGNLPDPGIEPGSPALKADSLPSELPGITKSQTWRSTKTFNFMYFTLSRLELSFVFYLYHSSLTFLTDFWGPDFPGYPSWVIFPSSSLMPWASNWIANITITAVTCVLIFLSSLLKSSFIALIMIFLFLSLQHLGYCLLHTVCITNSCQDCLHNVPQT